MTRADLCERLSYDPKTGLFRRLCRVSRYNVDHPVGYIHHTGYLMIGVMGRSYLAHRLAWLYMTGSWPKHQIDHKNHIGTDNRWCNLREATPAQNGANRRGPKPFKGATKLPNGWWQASIKVDGKSRYLGLYTSPEEAHAVYCKAAEALHGAFARKD